MTVLAAMTSTASCHRGNGCQQRSTLATMKMMMMMVMRVPSCSVRACRADPPPRTSSSSQTRTLPPATAAPTTRTMAWAARTAVARGARPASPRHASRQLRRRPSRPR
eukprot:3023748-Pleurochrysis_carterae.AAC.1